MRSGRVAIAPVVAAPGARYSFLTMTTGMSEMAISISPSPAARQIFNMMVVRSDEGYLSLAQSIALTVQLKRMDEDSEVGTAVGELQEADWIFPMSDGGWMVA